eukprot:m.158202 g.158202  ORF g.158202 m.158202 type:complete len:572 (-) comp52981_c0_seq1:1185-2900(-)
MEDELEGLEAQSARELQELYARRAALARTHKAQVAGLETQVAALLAAQQTLQHDCTYNLALLDARDNELRQYDSIFSHYNALLAERDNEISDLRIQLDQAAKDQQLQMNRQHALQEQHQHHIRETCDHYLAESERREAQHRMVLEDMDQTIGNLQNDLFAAKSQLEFHRSSLASEIQTALDTQHRDLKIAITHLQSQKHEGECTNQQLMTDVALLQSRQSALESEVATLEAEKRQLEQEKEDASSQHRHQAQEYRARIVQLEAHVSELAGERTKSQVKHEAKVEDLTRQLQTKDDIIMRKTEALQDSQTKHQNVVAALQVALKEKDEAAEALKQEYEAQLQELRTRLLSADAKYAELDRSALQTAREHGVSLAARDAELASQKQRAQADKGEIERLQGEVLKFKEEVTVGIDRENSLKLLLAQQHLDFEARLESVLQQASEQQDELSRKLLREREDLSAKIEGHEKFIQQQKVILMIIQRERDDALSRVASLEQAVQSGIPAMAHDEMQTLREQNAKFRDIIREMRLEMEAIKHAQEDPQPKEFSNADILQEVVQELKQESQNSVRNVNKL